MMGKVSLGGGRLAAPSSSSSSSHLSALAPPFTVDRSNSKPLSNQPSQFSEFPYSSNFAHTWNFANPVPALQSDEYHASELDADSCWSSVNPSAKSSTHPFLYERMPYVSSVVDNITPLVSVTDSTYDLLPSTGLASGEFSSQVDYTQSLSGLDYSSHWYGLVDAKRGKLAENDGTFHFQKTTTQDSLQYLNQGCKYCKSGNIFGSDYCTSCGRFSDSIARENCNGLVQMEHSDNGSLLSKDWFFPFDSAKRTSLRSELTNPKSLSLDPSMQSLAESVTYRNPSDPYAKRIQLSDCCVSGSVSVTISSPSSLIKTSNAGPGIGMLKSTPVKSVVTNDVTYIPHHEVIGDHKISKEKEPHVMLDPDGQECSFFASQAKSNKVDQEFSVLSSIMQEASSAPQAKDTPNSLVKVNFSSQAPANDLSIGCSSSGDNAQAIRSQEKFSDGLEHHIDSPCWKGAPSFHLSPFDVDETEATPHTKQRSEHCPLNHKDDQMLPLLTDPVKSPFGNTSDDKVVYGLGFAATEQRLMDAAKTKMTSPVLKASIGVQCCEYSSKTGEEHYLPSFSGTQKLGVQKDTFISTEPNIHAEVMDSMLNHDNIKEGGAVAVRAAEDVLSSLSSEESAVVQPKQKSSPRLDVQMLSNSMKNISELLLSYCCSDTCALKEQNLEVIEDVISNLHALLPKKTVHLTRPPASVLPRLETSDKTGDYFDSRVNTDAGRSQVAYDAAVNAQGQLDYQPTFYEEMKNCNGCDKNTQIWQHFSKIRDDADICGHASMTQNTGPDVSKVVQNAAVREQGRVNYQATCEKMEYDDCGEKAQRFQHVFQIRDDLDMFGDDSMTKSIRKVLDENFNCGEEIQPLALLFKNLWLEAEARLCRVSYKARFDRVKIEMESFGTNQMKENSALSKKYSSIKDPQDSSMSDVLTTNAKNGSMQETAIQSSANNDSNDVDAAVMARLQILKRRNFCEFDQSVGQLSDPSQSFSANNANDVDTSAMARLRILKGRSFSEFDQSIGQCSDPPPGLSTDELANPGSANGRRKCEFSPGSNDKASSEWEHVVKDDAW